jgi:carbamoyltransferase
MLVLGIHFGHGSAAALVDDSGVLAAIEEEKLNRVKGFVGYPFKAVEYVLRATGVSMREVDRVALGSVNVAEFSYNFIHLVRNIFQRDAFWPKSKAVLLDVLKQVRPGWDTSRLLDEQFFSLLEAHAGIGRDKVVKVNHHLAHAASAFYCSPWEEAVIITADGKGDGLCGGAFFGDQTGIRVLDSVPDRFSVGQFYQAVTKFLGYKVNRHEGKITGLAAFGSSEHTYPLMRKILLVGEDGQMDNVFYDDERMITDPVNYYESEVDDKSYMTMRYMRSLNGALRGYAIAHQRYQGFLTEEMAEFSPEDLAAGVQQLAEESLRAYAGHQLKDYLPCNVCLAGGVFANVKVNQRIGEIAGVGSLYVQPAMDDAGCALGAALQVVAQEQGTDSLSRGLLRCVYKGPEYDEASMEEALQKSGLSYSKPQILEDDLAEMLHAGKIIGRYTGGLEWGPRALGNRSILIRPTDKSINDTLNKRLNRTEFMPFAPSILAERAADYLVGYRDSDEAARFMTLTYAIRRERRDEIAAAVHVDGTARPQVVLCEDNPSLHGIISAYHRLSGIAAVVNTSFNMHEEPIVDTPDDAIRAFRAGAVDVLSMGPFVAEVTGGGAKLQAQRA